MATNNHTKALCDDYERQAVIDKLKQYYASGISLSPIWVEGIAGGGNSRFAECLIKSVNKDDALEITATLVNAYPFGQQESVSLAQVFKHWASVLFWGVGYEFQESLRTTGDQLINALDDMQSPYIDHITGYVQFESDWLNKLSAAVAENPRLIVIDDLGACSQAYQAMTMSVLKRWFTIDGLEWLVVEDEKRLFQQHSEKRKEASLNQFFNHRVILSSFKDKVGPDSELLSLQLLKKSVIGDKNLNESCLLNGEVFAYLQQLAVISQLNLRDINKLVSMLRLYHQLTDDMGLNKSLPLGYQLLHVAGVWMTCFRQTMSRRILKNNMLVLDSLMSMHGFDHNYLPVWGDENKDKHSVRPDDFVIGFLASDANQSLSYQDKRYLDSFKDWFGNYSRKEVDIYFSTYFPKSSVLPPASERISVVREVIRTLNFYT